MEIEEKMQCKIQWKGAKTFIYLSWTVALKTDQYELLGNWANKQLAENLPFQIIFAVFLVSPMETDGNFQPLRRKIIQNKIPLRTYSMYKAQIQGKNKLLEQAEWTGIYSYKGKFCFKEIKKKVRK